MPSREHAADLERVLSRAAQECESRRGIWFGTGLAQALRVAIEAHGRVAAARTPEIAFLEVSAVSAQGRAITDSPPPSPGCPVVGLSAATLDDLGTLLRPRDNAGVQIIRLICPVAVFDFSPAGVRIREVRHGLTAADIQRRLSIPLWSGPDLKELGAH